MKEKFTNKLISLVSQSEFEWYLSCQITDFSMFLAHCASRLIVLAQFVIYFMIVVGHYRTVLWSAIQQNTSLKSIVVVSKFFFWLCIYKYNHYVIISKKTAGDFVQIIYIRIMIFQFFAFYWSLILLPKHTINQIKMKNYSQTQLSIGCHW